MTTQTGHVVIVVADDDPAVNELVADLLSDEGYAVLCCYSGAEAISVIGRVVPDLAIIDLQMETQDAGLKVLASIRRLSAPSQVKVLIFSADEQSLVKHRGYIAEQQAATITKPFDIGLLLDKVQQLLAGVLP